MKLSRQEEIGLLLVTAIAGKPSSYVTLGEISDIHGVTLPFLKKVARFLRNKGILISKEGASGGYKLSKNPEEISCYEVISAVSEATEDKSLETSSLRTCPLQPCCMPQRIKHLITASFLQYLSDVTIDQFIKEKRNI